MAPGRQIAKPAMKLEVLVNGRPVQMNSAEAHVVEVAPGLYSVLHEGRSYEVRITGGAGQWQGVVGERCFRAELRDPREMTKQANAGLAHKHQDVKAPMPGKVIRVLVRQGDAVEAGQGLVVVEAMKMQNEMKALRAGAVLRVAVQDGDTVAAGDVLVTLD